MAEIQKMSLGTTINLPRSKCTKQMWGGGRSAKPNMGNYWLHAANTCKFAHA
jgi:hypothetical protein